MNPKTSILYATAFAVACSVLPIQSHAFEDADARRKINELTVRLKDLTTRIDNEVEKLAQRIDTKADDKKLNALLAELEKLRAQLRGEVAELRGQVEVVVNELNAAQQKVDKLSNDLANAQRREKDLYADINQRLSKLEPRNQTIDGVEVEVTQAEQKQFDEASALLKKKDFARASQAFMGFLQRFPGSGYAAQAYYFLGSSYFAAGDCKNAIPALQTVINRYAMTQRAPDAMLNLAICQDDLSDVSAARDTMEALIKKYPESSAAKTARAKLGALK
ncbi:MAG: tol-pal system protein YbgF [Pseudomonadota bacterium]|jgi:tol-pal system protein YbgF